MILIDACYINTGGGKILFLELLKELNSRKLNLVLLIDNRLEFNPVDLENNWKIIRVNGSLISRARQLILLNQHYKFESIFYFNGIPPIVRFEKSRTLAYFQNTTIFSSLKRKIYFKTFQKNVDTWIFQTEKTKEDYSQYFKSKDAQVLPFFPKLGKSTIPSASLNQIFFYPTSNHPHKNNNRLIEAFTILYEKGLDVQLEITIARENYPDRVTPNIKFLGTLKKEEIVKKYERGVTIMHPSLEESFGMVLIEACQFQLNIITADLAYIYQLIKPSATFNPYKTNSIVHSVEKAIKNSNLVPGELIIQNRVTNLINLISQPNV